MWQLHSIAPCGQLSFAFDQQACFEDPIYMACQIWAKSKTPGRIYWTV